MLASKLNSSTFSSFTRTSQKIVTISREIHFKRVDPGLKLIKWNSFEFPRMNQSSRNYSNVAQETPKKVKTLMTPEERQKFLDEFPKIVSDLANLEGYELMTETKQWANQVVEYNVPHGKHFRSSLLIKMATEMNGNSQNGRELPNLYKIGWIIEIMQACTLILDDMMDGSKTRRNEPCWYLQDDLGMAAINDGLLCESMAYVLLRKYVKGAYPMYEEILDLCHNISLKCIHGQSFDSLISRKKQYSMFTDATHYKISTVKNGVFDFYFPITFALLLNGVNDQVIFNTVENLSAEISFFFSMQDDYLDCFADVDVSGKIGTDIQDSKCSWVVVNALKKANTQQRKIILDNYGQDCPEKIAKVKEMYNGLGIPELYSQEQEKAFENLEEIIASLPGVVPKEPLNSIVNVLFKRSS